MKKHFLQNTLRSILPKLVLFFIALFFSFSAFAVKVDVYFFELKDKDGKYWSFEKDGRFWHVAMQYQGQFLEARPYEGVVLTPQVEGMGKVAARMTLEIPLSPEELDQRVQDELGKKFKLESRWDDPYTTQCSKLIAKILGLEPSERVHGKWTFSPESLFRKIHSDKSAGTCHKVF